MATNKVTKGNPADFVWVLKDVDGSAVPDLAAATEITFQARVADQLGTSPTPDLELKQGTVPLKVLGDDPDTGTVTIKADSVDMALAAGLYDLFLQVNISATRILEYQQLRALQVLDEGVT